MWVVFFFSYFYEDTSLLTRKRNITHGTEQMTIWIIFNVCFRHLLIYTQRHAVSIIIYRIIIKNYLKKFNFSLFFIPCWGIRISIYSAANLMISLYGRNFAPLRLPNPLKINYPSSSAVQENCFVLIRILLYWLSR